MLEARLQSVVLYAHSHVGSCFYPSLIAPVHPGPAGRDIFGETVALCHENDIAVVGYMSLIFDTLALARATGLAHNEVRLYGPRRRQPLRRLLPQLSVS